MAKTARHAPTRRCAIYTRKSSEEGLEQAFNSLDAQRDACEAYIRSQRHEGWTLLPARYDDGGYSGGTLERPALQRLLQDIGAGRLDLVVVYKVDRLTRSLADFAKIVEAFDGRGVSFVSVTQQFNTTTSMGRLTLNMLLSFAQFEREVTGERIRDKIAASKRKGMWMGGTVPLGYQVRDRKLVVNETEAALVRKIYADYLVLGSVRELETQLRAERVVSKAGFPLRRGALFHMLRNRIYRGEVSHKGNIYRGEHAAIIDAATWTTVEASLADNAVRRRSERNAAGGNLLTGIIFDGSGERLTPTFASKAGKRYRYYTSARLIAGTREASRDAVRCPAPAADAAVTERVLRLLRDRAGLFSALDAVGALPPTAKAQADLLAQAQAIAGQWASRAPADQAAWVRGVLDRVDLHADRLEVHLDAKRLLAALDTGVRVSASAEAEPAQLMTLSVLARLRRTGRDMALVIESGDAPQWIDSALARLIARAHALHGALVNGDVPSIAALAAREQVGRPYMLRLLRLAYLAPDIVEAILTGRSALTVNRLMKQLHLPLDWPSQRRALGLG